MANLAGVEQTTVGKIERGERTGPSVKKVADALGIPMEDLIEEEEVA